MLGTGILKGLCVTAKNLVGSYTNKAERLTTIQYPEESAKIPPNYRNYPFLVFDRADPDAGLRCVACGMCERACPPQCIYIVKEKVGAKMRPKVFDLDLSVCMGCGICVEVCPYESIKMDQHFEIATDNRFEGLLLHKEDLAKSNAYYHKLHPKDAEATDTILAEKKRKEDERSAAAADKATAAPAVTPAPAPAAADKTAVPAVPEKH